MKKTGNRSLDFQVEEVRDNEIQNDERVIEAYLGSADDEIGL